jgi:hypothetical protein
MGLLQVQVLNADTSREIDAAFTTLARERSDALFVDPNPFFLSAHPIGQSRIALRGPGELS